MLLVVTSVTCGTKVPRNPASNMEAAVAAIEGGSDAIFVTKCIWREDAYSLGNTTPKLALRAHQEMSIDFTACFLMHNGSLP